MKAADLIFRFYRGEEEYPYEVIGSIQHLYYNFWTVEKIVFETPMAQLVKLYKNYKEDNYGGFQYPYDKSKKFFETFCAENNVPEEAQIVAIGCMFVSDMCMQEDQLPNYFEADMPLTKKQIWALKRKNKKNAK